MTMRWRIDTNRGRAAARIAALIAVLFYAALVPGHLVSQFLGAEMPAATQAAGHHDHCNPGNATHPGQAKKSCPFCAGHAAFQFAAQASIAFVLLPRTLISERLLPNDEEGPRRNHLRPQSRGPPILPA